MLPDLPYFSNIFNKIIMIFLQYLQVIIVCSVAYVAGVLTIIGSTASVLYARQQLPAPEEIHLPLPTWHSLTESVFRTRHLPELDQSHSEILQSNGHKVKRLNSTRSKESRQLENKTEPTEFRQSRQLSSSLQFPGFLTLVMIKDTVMHLVSGLHSKYSTNGHSKADSKLQTDDLSELGHDLNLEGQSVDSMDENIDESDVICSCGCCGQNLGYDKLCYNLTSSYGNVNNKQNEAHGHWNSNGPKLKLGHGQGHRNSQMDNMNCFPDFDCQCCCAVTPAQEWLRLSDNSDLLKAILPFHRIEEPFAGMTFGFGTSASVTAAAG